MILDWAVDPIVNCYRDAIYGTATGQSLHESKLTNLINWWTLGMQQGPFKLKSDRSAMRQLALAIALVFAVFCFGPAGIAQQSVAPAGGSQAQDQTTPPSGGAVRESSPSASSSSKLVAVGMRELSPWSMFVSASLIVQAIMAGLVFASLVTWTIFVAKFIE